jgi:hypothetical protein
MAGRNLPVRQLGRRALARAAILLTSALLTLCRRGIPSNSATRGPPCRRRRCDGRASSCCRQHIQLVPPLTVTRHMPCDASRFAQRSLRRALTRSNTSAESSKIPLLDQRQLSQLMLSYARREEADHDRCARVGPPMPEGASLLADRAPTVCAALLLGPRVVSGTSYGRHRVFTPARTLMREPVSVSPCVRCRI